MRDDLKDRKAYIIYEKYYDFDASRVLSGGVQTYITNIIPILCEVGYICEVYQFTTEDNNQKARLSNCEVYSVPRSIIKGRYKTKIVLEYINKTFDKEKDLLIFADHILTTRNEAKHSLSIQHGIHWDISREISRMDLRMFLSKALFAYKMHRQMKYVKHVVCVDYNFLNWYRAQVDVPNTNFAVVPNFTQIAPIKEKPTGVINIIFARRFVKHRGTRIFAAAMERVLSEYENIHVTIAGRGPDEDYLHKAFAKWKEKVEFIHYKAEESLTIHEDKHIAVVPTVGSEGTSLSLLEAMSSQCAVIGTDVGGITNVILNGYNGLMVPAGDVDALYKALKNLIDTPQKIQKLAKKGYETVKEAFSYDNWAASWRYVLRSI